MHPEIDLIAPVWFAHCVLIFMLSNQAIVTKTIIECMHGLTLASPAEILCKQWENHLSLKRDIITLVSTIKYLLINRVHMWLWIDPPAYQSALKYSSDLHAWLSQPTRPASIRRFYYVWRHTSGLSCTLANITDQLSRSTTMCDRDLFDHLHKKYVKERTWGPWPWPSPLALIPLDMSVFSVRQSWPIGDTPCIYGIPYGAKLS